MNRREFVGSTLTLCGRLLLPAGILTAAGCAQSANPKPRVMKGATMGTYYRVTVDSGLTAAEIAELRSGIDSVFERVISGMSTYDKRSTLSRLNSANDSAWHAIDTDLLKVLREAERVSTLTGGAFDATVGPLVNLWGFGADLHTTSVPDQQSIASALARTGYRLVALKNTPVEVRKGHPEAYIDLSAIAKGFAVDEVGRFLESRGIREYLVDIGGDLRAGAHKRNGSPWRIAVETPEPVGRGVQRILDVSATGVATSGDYRNFFEQDGRRYCHTLDPRTGRPVMHNLASVTVLDASVMTADALATGLMVMGAQAGFEFAQAHAIPALFISREPAGLKESYTPTFVPYLSG